MTAYPAWTPAPRQGIVPLHPLGFGTILGRSFTALRQNPRVLLGFAIGVQAIAYIVIIAAVAAVAFASFSRLDTLRFGSDEYDAVLAGSVALTIIVGFVLTLISTAVSVVVQGVVVAEVAHEIVAEKLTLRLLWLRVRPVIWRLIGYSLLLILVIAVLFGALALVIVATVPVVPALGVVVAFLAVIAAIPVALWLSVKLLLVPAIIVIEHDRVFPSIARSWRLTRGRFWPTLGIIVVIAVVMGFISQAVSIPFSIVSSGLGAVFTPTGDPGPSYWIAFIVTGVLTQVITLLLQAVTVVVQATATTLIYADCRMRKEGLDLDLLAYVEQRDMGRQDLADPYLANIGATRAPQFAPQPYPYPAYGAPAGPPPGAYPPGYGLQAAPAVAPYPQAAPPVPPLPAADSAPAHPAPVEPAADPSPRPDTSTRWAAPGAPAPDSSDDT